MIDTLPPLTPAELVDLKAKAKAANQSGMKGKALVDFASSANPETILRLIDMVERRDEQVKKLRAGLSYHGAHDGGCAGGEYCTCGYTEALAVTEPGR